MDSASPVKPDLPPWVKYFTFPDNIGHLHKKDTPGKDGWGRAFCKGLEIAIAEGYSHVAHIEGDSIFKRPCRPIFDWMESNNVKAASVQVEGTVRFMRGWLETGLMFFSTKYLKDFDFIRKYDWPNRKPHPTPEIIIGNMIRWDVKLMPWKAWRADRWNAVTEDNVLSLNLDWLTHCWSDIRPMTKFAENILAG